MGAALHKSLYENEDAKVALLNIGSEELKGNNTIKNVYKILNDKNNLYMNSLDILKEIILWMVM